MYHYRPLTEGVWPVFGNIEDNKQMMMGCFQMRRRPAVTETLGTMVFFMELGLGGLDWFWKEAGVIRIWARESGECRVFKREVAMLVRPQLEGI